MRLRRRPSTASDLREYLRYLTVAPRYGSLFERLPDVWCALLESDSLLSVVIEDLDREERDRLLGLGVSVFLTDDFVRQAKTPPLFWIGPELIRRTMQNDSPILDVAAIRRANSSGGLNLFVWEADLRPRDEAGLFATTAQLMAAFLELHSGFRMREAINQYPFGPMILAALRHGGWLMQALSGEYLPVNDPDEVERARAPFILGLTRELARKRPGSWLSTVFDYQDPRLFLTPAEQRLVTPALSGRTDPEIAKALAVSISAVKKCWQSIYARASFRLPELLPDDPCDLGPEDRRGPEKKRRLLSYLRNHPEELRPLSSPSRGPKQSMAGRQRILTEPW
jgi:hypothetical protein